MKKRSLGYTSLAVAFFLTQTVSLRAQSRGEGPEDPGARQCRTIQEQAAGRWSDQYSPAYLLRDAKDKHRLDRSPLPGGTAEEPRNNYWMPIGPFAVNNPGTGAGSGRVTDFAFVAFSQRVYAATANGGLWFSDDGGNTWGHFSDYPGNTEFQSCGAIAVSPKGKQLFVGTGEGSRYLQNCPQAYQGYCYEGTGVVVSTDEGKTWTREPAAPDLTGHAFFSLAMDPADSTKIVGATTNGIYLRIKDPASPTGYRWQQQHVGTGNNVVSSVVVTRKNSQTTFFAARWSDLVYRSTDGVNWAPLGAGFPASDPATGAHTGRITLSVQAANPDMVYALIAGESDKTTTDKPGLFGIYRWSKADANWISLKRAKGKDEGPERIPFYDFMQGSGLGQMAFAVAPDKADRLFAGGADFFSYTVSGDSAVETRVCDYNYMVPAGISVLKFQRNPDGSFDPRRLWAGSAGGAYFSGNAQTPNPVFLPKNAGLPARSLRNWSKHPADDAFLYADDPENSGLEYHGGPVWKAVAKENGSPVWPDWNRPDSNFWNLFRPGDTPVAGDRIKAVAFVHSDLMYAGTTDGQVYRITAGGSNWVRLDSIGVPENDGGLPAFHEVPVTGIAVDPNDSTGQSIYITLGGMGDYRRVWRFDASTQKWEQRSGPNPFRWNPAADRLFSTVQTAFPLSMTGTNNRMYAAFVEKGSGNIFLASTPDGKAWSGPLRAGTGQTDHPVNITTYAQHGQEQLALTSVGLDHNLYVSTSVDGTTWSTPGLVLPALDYNFERRVSIVFFKDKLCIAYIGNDQNIYLISSADAQNWSAPLLVQPPGVWATNAGVSLAVFRNKLFLAWNNLHQYCYMTSSDDGIQWSKTEPYVVDFNKDYPVSLMAYDGLLYAFFTDNSGQLSARVSADGMFWPDLYNSEALVQSGYRSAFPTAPLVFHNMVYVGFADDQGDIYVGSSRDSFPPCLPNVQHNTLVVDPQSPNTLFVGNDAGVYYSTDAGLSWMPYSNGLPGVPVEDLKIFPPAGQASVRQPDSLRFLWAATSGRGMFERSLDKAFDNSQARLYIRKNGQDRGLYDLPAGADLDNSPDIKVCYPNSKGVYPVGPSILGSIYEAPEAGFYEFSELPDGLAFVRTDTIRKSGNTPTLVPPQEAVADGILQRIYDVPAAESKAYFRVFVQLHNRGIKWPPGGTLSGNRNPDGSLASNKFPTLITIYVLACPADIQPWPPLPSDDPAYWRSDTPDNINKKSGDWKLMGIQYIYVLAPEALAGGKTIHQIRENREQGVPFVLGVDLKSANLPAPSADNRLLFLVDTPFDHPLGNKPWTHRQVASKIIRH